MPAHKVLTMRRIDVGPYPHHLGATDNRRHDSTLHPGKDIR